MKRTLVSLLSILSIGAFVAPVIASNGVHQPTSAEDSRLTEKFEEDFYVELGNKLNNRYVDGIYEYSEYGNQ